MRSLFTRKLSDTRKEQNTDDEQPGEGGRGEKVHGYTKTHACNIALCYQWKKKNELIQSEGNLKTKTTKKEFTK